MKPFIVVRTYQIDLNAATLDGSFEGKYTYKRSNTNQVFDELNPGGQGELVRKFLANAYATNFTFNPKMPNLLYSPISNPTEIGDLLNNNQDFCYVNNYTLDIDPDLYGSGQNPLYDNLSNKALFFNGNACFIRSSNKNWFNVLTIGLGSFLGIGGYDDPSLNSDGYFKECQFITPKWIYISNPNKKIVFENSSFKAGEKVELKSGVVLKAGTSINSSKLGELDSRFESFKNRHIATPSEIEQACNSPQYKNSVKFARIASEDSTNFIASESDFIVHQPNYSIFPNPANNTVTVQAPKDETVISEIVLKNLLGMEVQRFVFKNPSSDVTIDVSTIPVGLYILNVNNFSTRLGIQR